LALPVSEKSQADAAIQKFNTSLGQEVLLRLGRPDDLRHVQVRPLWEGHYRVNILVGAELTSVKIAHSFFLVANRDGKVLASTPEMTRRYQLPDNGRTDP